jgi:hypothetical protein
MIQRIQTIYLLGAAVLTGLCFFFPVAALTTSAGQLDTLTLAGLAKGLAGNGLENLLGFIGGITTAVVFGTIFSYKQRKRQMMLCLIAIGLLLVLSIWLFVKVILLKNVPGIIVAYKLPLIFPLISAVLTFMAHRGIKKDEELVKSYDRLR